MSKLPLQSLYVLAQLYREQDISKVANSLCITTNAIYFHLKKVEESLGESVHYKLAGKIYFKPKFMNFMSNISDSFLNISSAYLKCKGEKSNISICSDMSFNILYLSDIISDMASSLPDVNFNIQSIPLVVKEGFNHTDIVITYFENVSGYKNKYPIVKERFFFAASKEYLTQFSPIKTLADLDGHNLLDVISYQQNDTYPTIKKSYPDLKGNFVHYDLSYTAIEAAKHHRGICFASELLLKKYVLSGELEYLECTADLPVHLNQRFLYCNDAHHEIVEKLKRYFWVG